MPPPPSPHTHAPPPPPPHTLCCVHRDAHAPGGGKENAIKGTSKSGLIVGLFGTLYTLAKEKFSDSAKVAVTTVIIDFILILVIFLNLGYPWVVNPDLFVWQVGYYAEIHKPLAAKGYVFYQAIFYVLVVLLYVSVGICFWVAWCFKVGPCMTDGALLLGGLVLQGGPMHD